MKYKLFKMLFLVVLLFLIGGMAMTEVQKKPPLLKNQKTNAQEKPPLLGNSQINTQEKPPLLGNPTNIGYGQVIPPPPPGQTAPPPPGQTASPPPPAGQVAPPPPPPGRTAPPPPNAAVALNGIQLQNASLAVSTAKKAKLYLTAGKIWTMTGPRG